MEALLEKLERTSADYDLEINKAKNKIMTVDRARQNRPELNEISGIEVVHKLTNQSLTIIEVMIVKSGERNVLWPD